MSDQPISRRGVLRASGVGAITGVTGCLRLSDAGDTGTQAGTDTGQPETETATATAGLEPRVHTYEPVLERLDFGDGDEITGNTTPAFGRSGNIVLAHEADYPVHDGRAEFRHQTTVKTDGQDVTSHESDLLEETAVGDDRYRGSWWTNFAPDDWELGTYTAELRTTDTVTGETTTASTTFSIHEDLRRDEIEVVSIEVPNRVAAGEELTERYVFRNLTSRASSYASPLEIRFEGSDWVASDEGLYVNLRADGITEIEKTSTPSQVGEYDIRIVDLDRTFSITVTE